VTVTFVDLALYWPRWVVTVVLGCALALVLAVVIVVVSVFCIAGALVTSAWRSR
jgi:hypothetical protein